MCPEYDYWHITPRELVDGVVEHFGGRKNWNRLKASYINSGMYIRFVEGKVVDITRPKGASDLVKAEARNEFGEWFHVRGLAGSLNSSRRPPTHKEEVGSERLASNKFRP